MILTLNLDHLDPDLIKFYEQESNKSLIQDALIHGYKIVQSKTYGLNFDNTNQDSSRKIEELSQENVSLGQKIDDLKYEIANLQTTQNLLLQENTQKLTTQFNQQKMELENTYLKRETEKRTLFEQEMDQTFQKKNTELQDYKNQIMELNRQMILIKDSERNHYESKINELQSKLDERTSQLRQTRCRGRK